MDPGHQLLQKLKLVPNLVNEDPSIITPVNILIYGHCLYAKFYSFTHSYFAFFPLDQHLIYGDALVRFLQAFGTTEQKSLCFK